MSTRSFSSLVAPQDQGPLQPHTTPQGQAYSSTAAFTTAPSTCATRLWCRAPVGWVGRGDLPPQGAEGPSWLQHLHGAAFPASAKQVPADSRIVLITNVINNSKTRSPGYKPAFSTPCSACFGHSAQTHHCPHLLGDAFTTRPWQQGAEDPHRRCTPELALIVPQSLPELCWVSLSSPAGFSPVPPSAASSRRKGLVLLPCLFCTVEPWLIIC